MMFVSVQVAVDKLTAEQLQLLRYRQQLLKYFDRLCTYEVKLLKSHHPLQFRKGGLYFR
jgi:hypothetical protein